MITNPSTSSMCPMTMAWGMNTISAGIFTSCPGQGLLPSIQWEGLVKSLLHCHTFKSALTVQIRSKTGQDEAGMLTDWAKWMVWVVMGTFQGGVLCIKCY